MPNSSRKHIQSEWEPHRPKITRLHRTPGMTLYKIKKIMLEQDQFDARYVFSGLFSIPETDGGAI
jgi:hypothetical protein